MLSTSSLYFSDADSFEKCHLQVSSPLWRLLVLLPMTGSLAGQEPFSRVWPHLFVFVPFAAGVKFSKTPPRPEPGPAFPPAFLVPVCVQACSHFEFRLVRGVARHPRPPPRVCLSVRPAPFGEEPPSLAGCAWRLSRARCPRVRGFVPGSAPPLALLLRGVLGAQSPLLSPPCAVCLWGGSRGPDDSRAPMRLLRGSPDVPEGVSSSRRKISASRYPFRRSRWE